MGYQLLYNAFEATDNPEEFCQVNYLDLRTMQEIRNVKRQLEEILHAMGAVIGQGVATKSI